MLHPQAPLHDAAPPAQREALLGLLGTSPTDFQALADIVQDDPVLLHALFRAVPLSGLPLQHGLREAVVSRLQTLGAALLTAWLLSRPAVVPSRTDAALRAHALRAAGIARDIAREQGRAWADEAALGCLWSRLGQLLRLGPLQTGGQIPTRVLNAGLAEQCGCPPLMIDALLLADASVEQARQAHPLAATVWLATRLASSGEFPAGFGAAELGVPAERLARIVAEWHAMLPVDPTDLPTPPLAETLLAPLLPDGSHGHRLVEAAVAGFAQQAFHELPTEALGPRYIAAARLLCGQQPALVVVAREGRIEPLPLTGDARIGAHLGECAPRLDDEASVLALALRSQTPTSYHREEGDGPGRSLLDWQLARWLGRSGFVCVPFMAGTLAGAVVVTPDRAAPAAAEATRMLVALSAVAASVACMQQDRSALEVALRERIEQGYRDHARRIAHEARNPLSVIRSYLHLIPQRHGTAPGLSDDLRIVQDEIERIGALIDAVARPPEPPAEPSSCHVTELLHDMRAMVGEPLFGSRGIHFELRTLPALPAAAMPASALRQVLLNLLHNAADTLHPGGRCTVALAGELIADGRRCLEIRVIDNGPGLPPDRLSDLFSPQASTKGGAHQGLGLAITREILERWQARILCRSQPSVGTSFQLLVPVVSE